MPGLLQPSMQRLKQIHSRADIYNLSEDTIKVRSPYDGIVTIFPKNVFETTLDVAATVFGDPIMRKDPIEWVKEVRRIKNRRVNSQGETEFFDKYIMSGKLFCPQIDKARNPAAFYGHLKPDDYKESFGRPISEAELEALERPIAMQAAGPLRALTEEEVSGLLAPDTSSRVLAPPNSDGNVEWDVRVRNARSQHGDDEIGLVDGGIRGLEGRGNMVVKDVRL